VAVSLAAVSLWMGATPWPTSPQVEAPSEVGWTMALLPHALDSALNATYH